MSKTTHAIMLINHDLESIGGLDGIVGDYMDTLQKRIHKDVEFIKEHFSEACLFDYYGIREDEN